MKRLRTTLLATLLLAGSVATFVAVTESPASASVTSTLATITNGAGTLPNGVSYTAAGSLNFPNSRTLTFSEPVTLRWKLSSLQCVSGPTNREAVTMPAGTVADVLHPRHALSTEPGTGEVTVFGVPGVQNEDESTFSNPIKRTGLVLASTGGRSDCGQGFTDLEVTAYQADLGLTKTGPVRVGPGGSASWTLGVTNAGPDASDGYTVVDTLPAGTTNVATTTPGCSVAGTTVTCVGTSLAANGSTSIAITGTAPVVPIGTTITNIAAIDGVNGDPVSTNDTASASSFVNFGPGICRGTPVTLLGGRIKSANDAETPCTPTGETLANITVSLGGPLATNPLLAALLPSVNVKGLASSTHADLSTTAGVTSVASATISIAGAFIRVGALEAVAAAGHGPSCLAPNVVDGSSTIVGLNVNGVLIPVGNQALTIPLVVGNLYLNQTVVTGGNTVVQRALFLDLPGTALDVVLGEAKAGVSC